MSRSDTHAQSPIGHVVIGWSGVSRRGGGERGGEGCQSNAIRTPRAAEMTGGRYAGHQRYFHLGPFHEDLTLEKIPLAAVYM